MRAVIFLGAPEPDLESLVGFVRDDDFVICADKGYEYAKALGVHIDAVLGDFDSTDIKNIDFEGIKVYPSEKDYTDCEIAVDFACDKGASEVCLLCATGGRSDHFLGNLYALRRSAHRGAKSWIYTKNEEIYISDGEFEANGKKGDILSVLPFPVATDFTTKNLKYALKNEPLPYTGISNVFLEDTVSLTFKGRAIVVIVRNV